MVLDTLVQAVMPNMHFELPINKCRVLRFVKPGTGKQKQTYIGVGDVIVYRGRVVSNDLFKHPRPEMPETVDLIDLTKGPYFHFVGRYLSTLTNFDFNDCFKNGSSQKEYFQMKDGSKIYKGIMLETNIPLGVEDISISTAFVSFIAGPIVLPTPFLGLVNEGGGHSSAAAFNPFGEYESLTFTVANKSEYVDPFDELLGDKQSAPVTLYIFADCVPVAEISLTDKMKPTTYTVPINKCEQLMFWLQCGTERSGQYVFYDMVLDKKRLVDAEAVTDIIPKVKQTGTSKEGKKGTRVENSNNQQKASSDKTESQKVDENKALRKQQTMKTLRRIGESAILVGVAVWYYFHNNAAQ